MTFKTDRLPALPGLRMNRRMFTGLGVATIGTTMMPGGLSAAAGKGPVHGLSAFGDLKYPADFTHFDYANPNAPKGGTWSTGYGNITYDSFNSFILKGNPAIGTAALIYDSLMVAATDEADSVYGLIAETAELADDGNSVVFNIRPEARHHDGAPITAEDVKFSFDILIEKGHPSYRVQLAAIKSVTVEDTLRVRYDFDPNAPVRDLPMMAASMSVLPKHWYADRDFAESSLDVPLGNGAYQIGKFEPGSYVTFDRVADHWAKDLPVNVGRNNFDHVRIDYFRDRTAQFEGFKGGAFTFNEEFWSKLWATGYAPEEFPAIARGEVVTDVLPDETPAGTQGYWFNLRKARFQDPRVRQAIAICFDFEWSNQRLFYNLYNRTDSFFEGGPMQAEGAPSPGELAILEKFADRLPAGLLEQPAYVPPVTDGSGRNRRALRRAGKLLDDAGWNIVDGKRQKDGEVLEIEFLHGSQGFDRISSPYVKNLEKLGIVGSVRTVDPAQYKKRTDDFDFDITVDRKAMSLTPGVELRDHYHSASANSPGSSNLAGLDDPVVDALIDLIERAEDRETLTSTVKALDRVLRAMHIWVPQWNKGSHTIAYWDIYDRPDLKPRYARGVIDWWWVDAEKEAKLKAAGRI